MAHLGHFLVIFFTNLFLLISLLFLLMAVFFNKIVNLLRFQRVYWVCGQPQSVTRHPSIKFHLTQAFKVCIPGSHHFRGLNLAQNFSDMSSASHLNLAGFHIMRFIWPPTTLVAFKRGRLIQDSDGPFGFTFKFALWDGTSDSLVRWVTAKQRAVNTVVCRLQVWCLFIGALHLYLDIVINCWTCWPPNSFMGSWILLWQHFVWDIASKYISTSPIFAL